MEQVVQDLLKGKWENHILPFFWQHGEDAATLREYMQAIHDANCLAVCVESRPHPDFCGDKWWQDMDVILEEARRLGMKVWILDDSHFPTGFANGAVKTAPVELHRQSLCAVKVELPETAGEVEVSLTGLIPPIYPPANMMEQYVLPALLREAPHFEDDAVLALTMVCADGEVTYLPYQGEETVTVTKPAGKATLWVTGVSRNLGVHREYINMLDAESVHLLIEAVYEPHWQHYREDFGKTIAGFFSDEPELGNGHLYYYDNLLGTDQDLPFAGTMPGELTMRLGETWPHQMYLLWDNDGDPEETARVRYAYMDAVTTLLKKNYSEQLGTWCREHGVQYIGHMIEDDNAHARTGASLGHYFRGLYGQDMAGIDDIGGQVLPQGEDEPKVGNLMSKRDGEFYHYMMGNLAASAAAIEPLKAGKAMCEIFGNYGWTEGVRLEKYLADHFLVRGINYFVPHAFSPAPYPDPDCPPHFYAHGHNPEYRHFGNIMAYMNRVATLTSGGHRLSQVAVLYHGEAEWAGKAMLTQKVARVLYEHQIQFDTLPADVFITPSDYGTEFTCPFRVNTQEYEALVIPACEYLPLEVLEGAAALQQVGVRVLLMDRLPVGASNVAAGDADGQKRAETALQVLQKQGERVSLENLMGGLVMTSPISPADSYIRILPYEGLPGSGKPAIQYFVNEGTTTYRGIFTLPAGSRCYWYDAWDNTIASAEVEASEDGRAHVALEIEPLKSKILVMGEADPEQLTAPNLALSAWRKALAVTEKGQEDPAVAVRELTDWGRSQCSGVAYPAFENQVQVTLPDDVAIEQPQFSGFLRYETPVLWESGAGKKAFLTISDAYEGVEVFVNGKSAGIQIAPPFRYDVTTLLQDGENQVTIEVATTLEREMYDKLKDDIRSQMRGLKAPVTGSGLVGTVKFITVLGE